MRRELTFIDYLKAAFHCILPVRGIGGLPLNYLFLALTVGFTIAYWPLALFCSAIEITYLMMFASHPRFQAIVRAKILQAGKREAEENLADVYRSLRRDSQVEYDVFCQRCTNSLKVGRASFGKSSGSILDGYEQNIRQLQVIFARMLRMRDNLQDNSDPYAAEAIGKRISEIQKRIDDEETPEVTKGSERNTLEILQKRLDIQSKIQEQVSHVTAEIERMNEELLLVRDQVIIDNSSPAALADKVTVTSGVIEQHSRWLRDQGQLLEQLEVQQ